MNHIVDTCPETGFDGGLNLLLHEADNDAGIEAGIYSDCSTREISLMNRPTRRRRWTSIYARVIAHTCLSFVNISRGFMTYNLAIFTTSFYSTGSRSRIAAAAFAN